MALKDLLKGSSGSSVKTLQELLNNNGYNLAVDGVFGAKTEAAVKNFQQQNNLAVDGIAGQNTMGALTGATNRRDTTSANKENTSSANKDTAASNENTSTANLKDYGSVSYEEYVESDVVKKAEAALQEQLAKKPGEYQSQWQSKIDDVLGKIENRDEFSYDVNEDALYQQYAQQYTQKGKMASQDVMGQAAAMTGGYGSSYATTAGNQAYQVYLNELNDVIPELYKMALDQYNEEGQELKDMYALYSDRESVDYGRYRDEFADWQSERDYLTNQYYTERDYDYGKYTDERDFTYGAHRDDIADSQWEAAQSQAAAQFAASLKQSEDRFNASMEYQRERDEIADDLAEREYQLAVKKYRDSQKAAAPADAPADKEPVKEPEKPTYTGSSYSDAVSFMESNGVPGGVASGVMTSSEWNRRKSSYQTTGQGGTEVKNYDSYSDYLADYTEYAIETYGK